MNNVAFSGMSLDSRLIKPGDLFIAVSGTERDGRQFIANAIENGAVAVITEPLTGSRADNNLINASHSVPLIPYSNLKNVLGVMASHFYGDPSQTTPVIGITGTNGKTSCAHFIAQLSQFFHQPCGVIGTLGAGFLPDLTNFNLTTPDAISLQSWLAMLKQQNACRVAMEVTSHALSQARVAGIQFHTAIFTNLTRDHLDYHENFEAYFQAKQRLFTEYHPKYAIINLEDPYGCRLIQTLAEKQRQSPEIPEAATQIIGFTTESQPPQDFPCHLLQGIISIPHLTLDNAGITADIRSPWGQGQCHCPLLGRFNLSNVLASVAAMCVQGFAFNEVLAQVSKLKPAAGRMHQLGGGSNEPHIVIDYAHTPDALAKVLSALRPHCAGKLWCIFGCGGDRDSGKRPLMAAIAEQGSDCIIVTQDNPRTEDKNKIVADILQGFTAECQNFLVEDDRARAIQQAIAQADPEDWIVIAGKGHETYQIIHTERIPFLDEEQARTALMLRRQVL